MKKCRCCLIALLVAVSICRTHAQPIHILATGDMHGWIESGSMDVQVLGGAAEMLAYWKNVEGYKPHKFLVLSAGDLAGGPALSTTFKGDPVINVMNEMGYDATAVGNHEFDYKVEHLQVWERMAKFPFVCANLTDKSGASAGFVKPYVIVNEDGVKVAVVGLVTTDLPNQTSNAVDYSVLPYAESLQRVVPQARKEGAQAIIVLAHVPQDELVTLAKSIRDLDIPLIIGGHSHELAERKVDNTWVVNSGEWWRGYTRIDLDYNPKTKKTIVLSSKQVWLQQDKPKADPAIAAETRLWKQKMGKDYGAQLGYTVTGLDEGALYNFINTCWLACDNTADVVLNNYGEVRQTMPTGAVTRENVFAVLPFNCSLYRIKLTGETLIKSLPNNYFLGMHREGESYVITKTGQPVDLKATYNVVVNNYMYDTSSLLSSADPQPVTIASDFRLPIYSWLQKHPTSKEKPIEKLLNK